ncbi:MAG: protein kinase domain-containing protein [Nannocystales bacterium]
MVADTEEGTFSPGTVFEAKYRIERILGRGGMGEVYAATHTLLDKAVAVKVLLPEYAADTAMVSRMTREARAASATGHPNIALVTDMGWTGDRPFIVMEMIEGETLESRIERGLVPVDLALTWMDQILDALEAVHAKELIHRDLKPANLMLTPSREGPLMIKVLDFGISKSTQADADGTGHTGTGQIVGTPRAMAPEQARALSDLDARADVHAAGAVLYTMLTGASPFAGPTIMAVLARLLEGRFEPASSLNPSVPPILDTVIAKALAVEREHRYSSARAMRLALADVRTQLDRGVARASMGPPSIQSDVDLPRDRTLETPTGSPTAVEQPTITSVAESFETQPSAAGEPSLQLDVPDGWVPGQSAAATSTAPRRARVSINWGWWVTVSVLLAVAVTAWLNWDALTLAAGDVVDEAGSSDPVLILVDTKPKGAIVFVDGVQNDDRPLQIPRSQTPVKLRVVAEGYEPRVMQVVPERTRRLKIELTRSR